MTAHPEFRTCPASGRTVVISPERADRPMTAATSRGYLGGINCPFCPGRESETPPELFAIRDDSGWRLRVVPNKFPAVRPDAPAFGFHEVLIETSAHVVSPTELDEDEFANLFLAYRERLRHHAANPRIQSVAIFKNVGGAAGATLEHLHSQLVALPFAPEAQAALLDRAGPCAICAMAAEPARIVAESENFVAACPFAPRFAFETWLMPKRHEPRFETILGEDAAELASLARRVLVALDRQLDFPAFNWILQTSPRGDQPGFHWHLEVMPRITRVAGFEWGTGVFINDVFPERAAVDLRDKLPA